MAFCRRLSSSFFSFEFSRSTCDRILATDGCDLNVKVVLYTVTKTDMMIWQSMRSVMPPCPGMRSPKSLILKARLKPDAKKPPKGATSEAKTDRFRQSHMKGAKNILSPSRSASIPGSADALCSHTGMPTGIEGTKLGSLSHRRSGNSSRVSSSWGQIMYSKCPSRYPHHSAKMTVVRNAPRKPSQVFFGESLMSGVLPQKRPKT
mmetsp:Transcript_65346/g.160901  ORF Transcript_65346/g.160901 Transcript_65346/m.160901 type:complete len:205 (-) Transcript_65346:953-1567(-)